MDYKTLIILIVMLLLIILAYRELTSFKEIFYEVLDGETKKNTDIMQNSLIKFAGQIKAINNDNLQQFRKISLLNNQKVKKIVSNHFTEDDDSNAYTDIQNISEKRDKRIINVHENNNYYMSDENDGHNNNLSDVSDVSSNKKRSKLLCEGDVCVIKNDELDDDIPVYVEEQIPVKQKEDIVEKEVLKLVDEYKYNELQDMAKKLGLSLNYKDVDGKTKIYKKIDLYNNIKANIK